MEMGVGIVFNSGEKVRLMIFNVVIVVINNWSQILGDVVIGVDGV